METFKDIKGYEGLYQIGSNGTVKSFYNGKERILKPGKSGKGYLQVCLCKDGKHKMYKIHRIVAETFLDNTDNLPCVNHKNEDKTDNRVENLEFCCYDYNNNYGTAPERISKKLSKTVYQYNLDGVLVTEYPSAREVERQLGFNHSNIASCCRGNLKSVCGFIWKYKSPEQ